MNTKQKKDKIADAILSYIIESNLKVNDKLPSEEELTARFKVSRVMIREGLQGLKFLGIIKSSTRGGTVIKGMDFPLLSRCLAFQFATSELPHRELIEARYAIEAGAIELICGKLSTRQHAKLRSVGSFIRNNDSEKEMKKELDSDCAFHRLILEYTGNAVLQSYSGLLDIFFYNSILQPLSIEPSKRVRREHTELADALNDGNLELARGLLKRHLFLKQEIK